MWIVTVIYIYLGDARRRHRWPTQAHTHTHIFLARLFLTLSHRNSVYSVSFFLSIFFLCWLGCWCAVDDGYLPCRTHFLWLFSPFIRLLWNDQQQKMRTIIAHDIIETRLVLFDVSIVVLLLWRWMSFRYDAQLLIGRCSAATTIHIYVIRIQYNNKNTVKGRKYALNCAFSACSSFGQWHNNRLSSDSKFSLNLYYYYYASGTSLDIIRCSFRWQRDNKKHEVFASSSFVCVLRGNVVNKMSNIIIGDDDDTVWHEWGAGEPNNVIAVTVAVQIELYIWTLIDHSLSSLPLVVGWMWPFSLNIVRKRS